MSEVIREKLRLLRKEQYSFAVEPRTEIEEIICDSICTEIEHYEKMLETESNEEERISKFARSKTETS